MPLLAAAQWVYLDQSGRKVFSDKAPPPEVTRILRQPGMRPGSSVAVEDTAAAAPASPAAAAASRAAGIDKNLEARKKQGEAEAEAKKRAEEEKVAAMRADTCTRARGAKADFESGVRIVRTNAQGEREVMDDKQRESEIRRLDGIIATDCKK